MKKLALSVLCIFLLTVGFAQKFAYVDTEYILNNITKYQTAKDELDKLSEKWQKEIEDLYADIDKTDRNYQSEKVLLTEEMRKKQEDEILSKIKTAKELQKKYFGKDGDLFKKRQELVKPIQDEIFNTVKEIAKDGNYDFIFDIASGSGNFLFTNTKYDKSDDVLEKMGFKK